MRLGQGRSAGDQSVVAATPDRGGGKPKGFRLILAVFMPLLLRAADLGAQGTGPWDPAELQQVPEIEWGRESGGIREVYYRSLPFKGAATRVFAYFAAPEGPGPHPAVALVHGGGMSAEPGWVSYWAARGYAALAMDLNGVGPDGLRLPEGGPDTSEATWCEFSEATAREMWPYHAVAAVCRGISVLRTLPEVDPVRIGIHGLSWGGYVSCLVAALDDRVACAATVFGAGFLYEDSWYLPRFAELSDEARGLWIRWFDPSSYLAMVRCPILFANGATDEFFPPNSYAHSYALVRSEKHLAMPVARDHGRIWRIQGGSVDVERFVDHKLKSGPPLPTLDPLPRNGNVVSAAYSSPMPLGSASLWYTTDLGPWKDRRWTQQASSFRGGRIFNELPASRPLAYFQEVRDQEWGTATTPPVLAADLPESPVSLVGAEAVYEAGTPSGLGQYQVTGLVAGQRYRWTRISSLRLELPDGRALTSSGVFTSPGSSVVLARLGQDGGTVADLLDPATAAWPEAARTRRFADGTELTFQRNTIAPGEVGSEEWHPSAGTACECRPTPRGEWLLNDGLVEADLLARETLVIAPPGSTTLNVRLIVRRKEGDAAAAGSLVLTDFNGTLELEARQFTLDAATPRTVVTLEAPVREHYGYRVWIRAAEATRFAGTHRFIVEHIQVRADGSGVFGSNYVRIGLTRPMWSVRQGTSDGLLLRQRLYDQDPLSGLKLRTNGRQLAVEYRSDVLPYSPQVAAPAVVSFEGGAKRTWLVRPPDVVPRIWEVDLGEPRERTLHLVGGGQLGSGLKAYGTLLRAVWVPENAWREISAKTDLVVLSDSVSAGYGADPPGLFSTWALLRQETGLDVTLHGWGNLSLYDLSGDLPGLARTLLAAGNRNVWLALGITDRADWDAARFEAAYGELCDRLIALQPAVRVYCQTPTPTIVESQLPPYRAAIARVVAARASKCVLVDGAALFPVAELSEDGFHPSMAGHGTMYRNVLGLLRSSGLVP